MVIVIKQVESGMISLDNSQYLFCIELILSTFHYADDLPELVEPSMILSVAFQNVFFQYRISPTAEFHTALRLDTISYGNDDIKVVINWRSRS